MDLDHLKGYKALKPIPRIDSLEGREGIVWLVLMAPAIPAASPPMRLEKTGTLQTEVRSCSLDLRY